MRLLLFALFLGTAALGAPVEKLTGFELADQNLKTRIYRFPKSKVTVMTVADHKGSGELAPWIQQLYDRYQKKIDIDGLAMSRRFRTLSIPSFGRRFANNSPFPSCSIGMGGF